VNNQQSAGPQHTAVKAARRWLSPASLDPLSLAFKEARLDPPAIPGWETKKQHSFGDDHFVGDSDDDTSEDELEECPIERRHEDSLRYLFLYPSRRRNFNPTFNLFTPPHLHEKTVHALREQEQLRVGPIPFLRLNGTLALKSSRLYDWDWELDNLATSLDFGIDDHDAWRCVLCKQTNHCYPCPIISPFESAELLPSPTALANFYVEGGRVRYRELSGIDAFVFGLLDLHLPLVNTAAEPTREDELTMMTEEEAKHARELAAPAASRAIVLSSAVVDETVLCHFQPQFGSPAAGGKPDVIQFVTNFGFCHISVKLSLQRTNNRRAHVEDLAGSLRISSAC
jgi:hypothetical protein